MKGSLMTKEQLYDLSEKYFSDKLSPEEHEELNTWYYKNADKEFTLSIPALYHGENETALEMRLLAAIHKQMIRKTERPVHFLRSAWFRYAAILLLIAGTGIYLYTSSSLLKRSPDVSAIDPGGNRAILTLADGSTIVLNNAAIGPLVQQGSTTVLKPDSGSLAYQAGIPKGKILYNTITTPKGGQYRVTLPDGTKVWLNAASSIQFATAFETERNVSVTGEAYFEIAPDVSKPFFVKAGAVGIQVLGTRFNINAYADEPGTKVSLLEGSIKVDTTLLKPGTAYMLGKTVATDIYQDIAWKEGEFNFNNISLQQALRQLARWYDVEMIYETEIPDARLSGKISRTSHLYDVLNILTSMDLEFRIEGRRVIISNWTPS